MTIKKACIVGASGKLGQYMVQHAPDFLLRPAYLMDGRDVYSRSLKAQVKIGALLGRLTPTALAHESKSS